MFSTYCVGHDLVPVYSVIASQRDLEYMSATVHHTETMFVVGYLITG